MVALNDQVNQEKGFKRMRNQVESVTTLFQCTVYYGGTKVYAQFRPLSL